MAILKCKMCGGDLTVEPEMTVCECEYCGTKQTVPDTNDEKKLKLYERANRLRFRSEFDKASSVYESLIEEYPEEAEAYWGNLLCKYGIEYVDDPATGDKVPTCHRSSFDSFMDDPDFEMVMENADAVSCKVYREQAKQIEEIRKGIIEVSGKEQPYDIFICYKETDDDGERTIDSVLAQDVYEALTEKGYRVFFSRISLEDKLGTEYEPYIFAALNSAKVMLAFGTCYEYYNAVWVKNEWSRFLKLMAKDKKKYLIPCYKDIDAYDMPKEFARFQAQDLGKVGAIQDLLRGINKIIEDRNASEKKTQLIAEQTPQLMGTMNISALLKRGNMALEDADWDKADGFFEEVLNYNAEHGEAYLGKLLASNKASSLDQYFTNLEKKYLDYTGDLAEACPEDEEYISQRVQEYYVPGYFEETQIRSFYKNPRTFESETPCRIHQKEQQLTEINGDRMLFRVRQFLDGNQLSQIEEKLKELENVLDNRIEEAKIRDTVRKEQAVEAYKSFLRDADKKMLVAYKESKPLWLVKLNSLMPSLKRNNSASEINQIVQETFRNELSRDQINALNKKATADKWYGGNKNIIGLLEQFIRDAGFVE